MAFTGKIGSPDSKLGNIVLGLGAVPALVTSDSLSLTSTASATIKSTRNVQAASQLVSLTQSVVLQGAINKHITHTLNLTQYAFSPRQIEQTITDTLTITDVSERGAFYVVCTDALSINDSAANLRLNSVILEDILTVTDLARLSERPLYADELIRLTDLAVCVGPHYVSAINEVQSTILVFDPLTVTLTTTVVGITDVASALTQHNNVPAESIISLSQQAIGGVVKASGTDLDASDTITLDDIAQLSIVQDLTDTLELTDAASAQSGLPLSNELSLSDVATLAISHAGTELSDTIGISDAVRFVLERECNRFNFAPNIGSSTDPNAPTLPASTMPVVSGYTGVRLMFPHTGMVTDEVILNRRPEFGNIDRFQFDRINRETRGGTLIVYADPIWPKINTLVLKFSAMKKADAYALRDFMAAHPGQDIKLIDHENRAWVGVITKQQDPMIQDDRNSFTSSFEFEGERVGA